MLEQAREPRAPKRIGDEDHSDHRQRPAERAARRFEQRDQQDRSHHDIDRERVADAEGEVLEDVRDVEHRRGHRQRKHPVEPGHAAGPPPARFGRMLEQRLAVREHQEHEAQHEGQVHAAVRDLLQQSEARGVVVEDRQQDQEAADQRRRRRRQRPEAHLGVELALQFIELADVECGGGHGRLTSAGRLPCRTFPRPDGTGCPRPSPRFPW